ncbi:hypothetical protein [Microcystis sp. LEGE 08355]|nr:hypothetical protein [Microcystis sp. LEGE 08355]
MFFGQTNPRNRARSIPISPAAIEKVSLSQAGAVAEFQGKTAES